MRRPLRAICIWATAKSLGTKSIELHPLANRGNGLPLNHSSIFQYFNAFRLLAHSFGNDEAESACLPVPNKQTQLNVMQMQSKMSLYQIH